jgi:hypothetical protein
MTSLLLAPVSPHSSLSMLLSPHCCVSLLYIVSALIVCISLWHPLCSLRNALLSALRLLSPSPPSPLSDDHMGSSPSRWDGVNSAGSLGSIARYGQCGQYVRAISHRADSPSSYIFVCPLLYPCLTLFLFLPLTLRDGEAVFFPESGYQQQRRSHSGSNGLSANLNGQSESSGKTHPNNPSRILMSANFIFRMYANSLTVRYNRGRIEANDV